MTQDYLTDGVEDGICQELASSPDRLIADGAAFEVRVNTLSDAFFAKGVEAVLRSDGLVEHLATDRALK